MSNETSQTPAVEQPASLTVQDLASLKTIIEVVSSRGAFKAEELATVGAVYNKLQAFMAAVTAQQPTPVADVAEAM